MSLVIYRSCSNSTRPDRLVHRGHRHDRVIEHSIAVIGTEESRSLRRLSLDDDHVGTDHDPLAGFDLDRVVRLERHPTDLGSVARPEILDEPQAVLLEEPSMPTRDRGFGSDSQIVGSETD